MIELEVFGRETLKIEILGIDAVEQKEENTISGSQIYFFLTKLFTIIEYTKIVRKGFFES